jgi:predicted DNA-binding ribbon-helix-helix protein
MSSLDENLMSEEVVLRVRPRESEKVSISIPKNTLESLQEIAAQRDMSVEALLRLYVGKGLRQDLSQQFADATLHSKRRSHV